MRNPNYLLSLSLGLLVLFQGSSASRQQWQFKQDICQINKLNSLEPDSRVEFEGGRVESWDPTHQQFQCSGVAVVRKIIEPNGLLLPSYSNAAQLVYVVQGKGYTGIQLPGCPETYQESQGGFQGGGREGGSSFQDQHQKVRRFRQGDVLALPAGVSHWCYNDGNEPAVFVVLLDTSNTANQLDFLPRNFYLAGNPEEEFKQLQGRRGSHMLGSGRERIRQEGQKGRCNNVFCGMDTRLLAEAFNIDESLASRLQNENDGRGNIIRVEGGLEVVRPPRLSDEREERHREPRFGGGRYANGLEETLCSMRFKENIGNPERADIFTPEAGRLSTVNSKKLPILRWLQLSAERGVLYTDGLMLPHWNLNSHSIMYVIRGQARVQVVDHQGQNVFDGQCQEGQVLVVPQNFAVVKRCESDRFEWVSFKTNDNAMINPLAGKTSAFRALPAEVLANAFQVSLEDARRLKFQRHEATIASSRSSQSATRFADA